MPSTSAAAHAGTGVADGPMKTGGAIPGPLRSANPGPLRSANPGPLRSAGAGPNQSNVERQLADIQRRLPPAATQKKPSETLRISLLVMVVIAAAVVTYIVYYLLKLMLEGIDTALDWTTQGLKEAHGFVAARIGDVGTALGYMEDGVKYIATEVSDVLSTAIGWIREQVSSIASTIYSAISTAVNAIIDALNSIVTAVYEWFEDMIDNVVDFVTGEVWEWIQILGAFFLDVLDTLLGWIPGLDF